MSYEEIEKKILQASKEQLMLLLHVASTSKMHDLEIAILKTINLME